MTESCTKWMGSGLFIHTAHWAGMIGGTLHLLCFTKRPSLLTEWKDNIVKPITRPVDNDSSSIHGLGIRWEWQCTINLVKHSFVVWKMCYLTLCEWVVCLIVCTVYSVSLRMLLVCVFWKSLTLFPWSLFVLVMSSSPGDPGRFKLENRQVWHIRNVVLTRKSNEYPSKRKAKQRGGDWGRLRENRMEEELGKKRNLSILTDQRFSNLINILIWNSDLNAARYSFGESREKLGHLWAIHFTPPKQISNLKDRGREVKGKRIKINSCKCRDIMKGGKRKARKEKLVKIVSTMILLIVRKVRGKEIERDSQLLDWIGNLMKIADTGFSIHCNTQPPNVNRFRQRVWLHQNLKRGAEVMVTVALSSFMLRIIALLRTTGKQANTLTDRRLSWINYANVMQGMAEVSESSVNCECWYSLGQYWL